MKNANLLLFLFVLFLSACSNNQQQVISSHVITIEKELEAFSIPLDNGHEEFKKLVENIPVNAGDRAITLYFENKINPLAHDLSEKNLSADNKCYEIQQRVESSTLPKEIKSELSSVIFQQSRCYYCRWQSYEMVGEAIAELESGNKQKFDNMIQQAADLMEEGTRFLFAAVAKTKALNDQLGISSDQK